MRSLTARLEALERLLAGSGCTCPKVIVFHEHNSKPLSDADKERQLAGLPHCPVHGRKPAGLVVILRHFGPHLPSSSAFGSDS
jgi:hypothetical protein